MYSPIRVFDSVPSEVILHIIKLGFPCPRTTESFNLPQDLKKSNGMALKLSTSATTNVTDVESRLYMNSICQINHHLRELVINDPSFWQNITVHVATDIAEVETRLSRSRQQPIDVCIIFAGHSSALCLPSPSPDVDRNSMAPNAAKKIFLTLYPHFSRFRSLFIETTCKLNMSIFTRLLSTIPSGPTIQSLNLVDTNSCQYPSHRVQRGNILMPFSGQLPSLKELSLTGFPAFAGIILTTAVLKDLHLRFELVDVLSIAAGMTRINALAVNLTRLSLTTFGIPVSSMDSNPLHLPSLRHLDISCWNGDEVIRIIRTFRMPSIRILGLNIGYGMSDELWTQLRERDGSVQQTLRDITTLIIHHFPVPEGDLSLNFIDNLQSVVNLVFRIRLIDETRIITHLCHPDVTHDGKIHIRCPKLENVMCANIQEDNIKMLVTYRRFIGHPLKSVHIPTAHNLKQHNLKWLREKVRIFTHAHFFNS